MRLSLARVLKGRARSALMAACALAGAMILAAPASAQKPYDDKLIRLSEILGAVHYLRELCGSGDGQLWRDRMKELMDAEGSSAMRKAQLARQFNEGYRSYSRTYSNCTPSAKTAVGRFLEEGMSIADGLVAEQTPKPAAAPDTKPTPKPPKRGNLQ